MLGIWKTKKEYEEEFKQKFQLLHQQFAPAALSGEDLKTYYVSFAGDMMKEFKTYLKVMDRPGKFLFTGQRGCGKSTELNQLAKDLKDDYVVIPMSVKKIMDTRDPDFHDILLLMAIKLLEKLIEMDQAHNFIKPIKELLLLAEVKPEEMPENILDKPYLSFEFQQLCEIMKTQATKRKTIRERTANNLHGITIFISNTAKEFKNYLGKNMLLIVDDLDKIDHDVGLTKENEVDKSLRIFRDNVQNLILPECHVIYTMPFSLYHRDEFSLFSHEFDDCLILSSLNIYKKEEKEEDGKKKYIIKENEKQIEIFENILTKRITPVIWKKKKLDPDDVFEDEVMDDLIIRSGGLVADLMEMMRQCCFALTLKPRKKIDSEILTKATEKWQMENSRLLNSKEKSILRKVFDSKSFKVVPDERLPLYFREGLILEQREKEIWYDIHPLLRKIIGVDEEPDHVYK